MKVKKRDIVIFSISLVMICLVTFSARLVKNIDIPGLKEIVLIFINLLNGLIALIAAKLSNMKINIDLKNKRQYLIGILIALVLSAAIAIVPALFGFSLVGNHIDFSWSVLADYFFYYMLLIGPVEEFVFRVYLQETLISFFEKNKWLGVVIASFLFGLWHLINGSFIQVIFTFGMGLVFGFAKYKIKECGYVGVAFAHGLYDFLNTVVRMLIV